MLVLFLVGLPVRGQGVIGSAIVVYSSRYQCNVVEIYLNLMVAPVRHNNAINNIYTEIYAITSHAIPSAQAPSMPSSGFCPCSQSKSSVKHPMSSKRQLNTHTLYEPVWAAKRIKQWPRCSLIQPSIAETIKAKRVKK